MEKRIHHSTAPKLTCYHYILHLKWQLLSFISMLSFIILVQMNSTTWTLSYSADNHGLETLDMHHIDSNSIENHNNQFNENITLNLIKKDKMKILDDNLAMNKNQKVILPLVNNQTMSTSYTILEFTNIFGKARFCSNTNEQIFGKTCPYVNCKYTCNRTYENVANVLLMHKRDLDYSQLSRMKRNLEQVWLLWHDEANENSPNINAFKFNWTMTYRTDAEASLGAYGIAVPKQNPWSQEEFNIWLNEQFNKRYNQAVWFVSNCKPKKRLMKFHSLRRLYPIAAFGACILPHESFSLNAQPISTSACQRQSSCEKHYLMNSKFYLAFESQSCRDYITEKFWRTLSQGAIPIVSGPAREDFVRIAPPDSFIHVDDYATDEELVRTLNSIAKTKSSYEKYHQWRRYYNVYYEAKHLDPFRFCELCYRLNTQKQRIWYEKINEWFLDKC